MDTIETLYYIRDGVACLGVLVGFSCAIFLFIRKKTLPAVLALLGFLMLGVEPLLDIIIWRIVPTAASNPNWDAMNQSYACVSGATMFLGILLIALAFILGFREAKLPPPPPVDSSADLPPAA